MFFMAQRNCPPASVLWPDRLHHSSVPLRLSQSDQWGRLYNIPHQRPDCQHLSLFAGVVDATAVWGAVDVEDLTVASEEIVLKTVLYSLQSSLSPPTSNQSLAVEMLKAVPSSFFTPLKFSGVISLVIMANSLLITRAVNFPSWTGYIVRDHEHCTLYTSISSRTQTRKMVYTLYKMFNDLQLSH